MTLQFKSPVDLAKSIPTKKDDDIVWTAIDVNTLPDDLKAHWEAYRKAQNAANEAKRVLIEEFSEAVIAPAGQQLLIATKFGKLSYGFKPASPKANPKAVSFSSLNLR